MVISIWKYKVKSVNTLDRRCLNLRANAELAFYESSTISAEHNFRILLQNTQKYFLNLNCHETNTY